MAQIQLVVVLGGVGVRSHFSEVDREQFLYQETFAELFVRLVHRPSSNRTQKASQVLRLRPIAQASIANPIPFGQRSQPNAPLVIAYETQRAVDYQVIAGVVVLVADRAANLGQIPMRILPIQSLVLDVLLLLTLKKFQVSVLQVMNVRIGGVQGRTQRGVDPLLTFLLEVASDMALDERLEYL